MEYIVFGIGAGAFVILMIAKGFYDSVKEKKNLAIRLRTGYGDIPVRKYDLERYQSIARYYEHHKEQGQLDDITWNDLGMDEIFKRMNYTHSSVGEEYLYHTLRTPKKDVEELAHMEELAQYFSDNEEARVKLQLLFCKLGYTGRYSMYDYLDHLDVLGERSNLKHYITDFLYILAFALCFFQPSFGIISILILMFYSMFTYFADKSKVDTYLTSFAYVMHLLKITENVTKLLEKENITGRDTLDKSNVKGKDVNGDNADKHGKGGIFEREIALLEEHAKPLRPFKRGSFWLMSPARMSGSGNPLDIVLDYMRMVFHPDLIKFNSMLNNVKKHMDDVDALFGIMGYLESTLVVGEYRHSIEGAYCVPKFFEEKHALKIENVYHPLIEDAVKNTIETNRGVLLTGSNASGKSTFLKSVAISAVMAQTIHTVCADCYEGNLYRILSSMSLKDNILAGESYYIVEIRAIKRILDFADSGENILCFVDEVLRGTNTVERIAASTEILFSLAGKNMMCFAATHDIELTDLLQNAYDNYHFEEEIKHGDVTFSYCLKDGKATTRNAIKLLSVMGYEQAIVRRATERAEAFVKTGNWIN